jgi:hypothetical protein
MVMVAAHGLRVTNIYSVFILSILPIHVNSECLSLEHRQECLCHYSQQTLFTIHSAHECRPGSR